MGIKRPRSSSWIFSFFLLCLQDRQTRAHFYGVTDENRAIANKHFVSNLKKEIKQDGDNWSIKTITDLGEREVSFTIGKEFTSATLDGRAVKTVVTIDGDALVETMKGEGFTSVNCRRREGDLMVMTMTGGGIVCTRKYKSV